MNTYEGWEEAVGVGATPIPQIITGAASGSWWSGNLNDDSIPMAYQRLGGPRGFLVIEFDGNTFKDRFKATGKPMDKQLTVDFLSPTFNEWYASMLMWLQAGSVGTPPVNINELPDTAILTEADMSGGTHIVANVWNGTRDSKVMARINDGEWIAMERTQQGAGEGFVDKIDSYAIRQQMYVFRFAARSTTGTTDIPSGAQTQGFRLFGDARFGPADPQSLPKWMLADQSNHLWAVELPGDLPHGAHKLTVKTVDRFGREFYETKLFEVRDQRPPAGWNGGF